MNNRLGIREIFLKKRLNPNQNHFNINQSEWGWLHTISLAHVFLHKMPERVDVQTALVCQTFIDLTEFKRTSRWEFIWPGSGKTFAQHQPT